MSGWFNASDPLHTEYTGGSEPRPDSEEDADRVEVTIDIAASKFDTDPRALPPLREYVNDHQAKDLEFALQVSGFSGIDIHLLWTNNPQVLGSSPPTLSLPLPQPRPRTAWCAHKLTHTRQGGVPDAAMRGVQSVSHAAQDPKLPARPSLFALSPALVSAEARCVDAMLGVLQRWSQIARTSPALIQVAPPLLLPPPTQCLSSVISHQDNPEAQGGTFLNTATADLHGLYTTHGPHAVACIFRRNDLRRAVFARFVGTELLQQYTNTETNYATGHKIDLIKGVMSNHMRDCLESIVHLPPPANAAQRLGRTAGVAGSWTSQSAREVPLRPHQAAPCDPCHNVLPCRAYSPPFIVQETLRFTARTDSPPFLCPELQTLDASTLRKRISDGGEDADSDNAEDWQHMHLDALLLQMDRAPIVTFHARPKVPQQKTRSSNPRTLTRTPLAGGARDGGQDALQCR